jgi:hypothetical protein
MWFWVDKAPDFYNRDIIFEDFHLNDSICSYVSIVSPIRVFGLSCFEPMMKWALCQKTAQSFNKTSSLLLPLNFLCLRVTIKILSLLAQVNTHMIFCHVNSTLHVEYLNI